MDEHLYRRFMVLEEQKDKLLASFEQWNADQLQFKPRSDQWSLIQVLDHMAKVDISITNYLQKYQSRMSEEKLGLVAWCRTLFLKMFLLTPLKIKAPRVPGIQPKESVDLQSIAGEWSKSRLLLTDYLETFPKDKLNNFVFKHPLSGKLNVAQTLIFIHYHAKHHDYQLKRIISHSKFPMEAG